MRVIELDSSMNGIYQNDVVPRAAFCHGTLNTLEKAMAQTMTVLLRATQKITFEFCKQMFELWRALEFEK